MTKSTKIFKKGIEEKNENQPRVQNKIKIRGEWDQKESDR